MKLFETPVIEVLKLQVTDVIATSSDFNCRTDMGDF